MIMLKLPLGQFVVYTLYNELCSKYGENRTDGVYALVYRSYSIDGQR